MEDAMEPVPQQNATYGGRGILITSALALLAVALMGAGYAAGGEARTFISVGLQFIPLALLAALAYAGVKHSAAAVFTYVWLAILTVLIWVNVIVSIFIGVIKSFSAFDAWSANRNSVPLSDVMRPEAGAALFWAFVLLTLISLFAASMLFRPVRALMSRIMPIDPDSFVHKIALAFITLLMLSSFVPLLVLSGRPPLLELVKGAGQTTLGGQDISVGPLSLVYQFAWMVPATLVAAGWPVSRSLRTVFRRLDFVRPTLLQVAVGVGLGVGLAFVSSYLIEPAISQLWQSMGWATTDVAAFNRLMSRVITPLGAVLIGVTAGIGEEMAVRGLLQPRIGLIASNLLFTSLHAFQYGFDGLLSVFIVGTILGLVRMRSNTSTSAVVHGTYNFTLVMMSVLAGQ